VIENWICKGTDCLKAALRSGLASLLVEVVSARIVSRGACCSDLAVSGV